MAYDPDWAAVKLLIQSETTNNATVFLDTSENVGSFTVVGAAKHSTAVAKFGASSMLFTPGSYIYTNTDVTLPGTTNPMTIEAWVYPTDAVYGGGIVSTQHTSSVGITFGLGDGGPGSAGRRPYIGYYVSGWVLAHSPDSIPQNQWTHLRATYDGTNMRLFVDGVLKAVRATSMPAYTGRFYIGCNWSGNDNFYGRIEELRFTPNVCRNTTDFTPPTEPFVWGVTTTLSGVTLDRTGAPAQRQVFIYARTTGGLIGSILSDPITGEWSTFADGTCFAVCLSDDSVPIQASLILDRLVPV